MRMILYWLLALGCASAYCGDGDFACRVRAERLDGAQTNRGTASAISAHTLVTAAHVVDGAEDVFIEHAMGWLRCRVVKVDSETDLAVLECSAVELNYIAVDAGPQHAGAPVTLWSSILGAKVKALAGKLRRLWDATPRARWLCDVPKFDHGGSGSPVVAGGKLIGVATAIQADRYGLPVANTAIMVPAVCVQVLLDGAPVIEAPVTKAEVIELPAPKVEGLAGGNGLKTRLDFSPAYPSVCASGTCRAVVKHSLTARHWDSDCDGHGQGGWVYE